MSVPFLLAPMASLSHRPLRELLEGFGGCDLFYSEMIGAGAFLTGGPFEAYYADPLPAPDRLVYQLMGGEVEPLVKAARLLDERKTVGIDLNMGCSAPEIIRQGAGVSWMKEIERARGLVGSVRPVVSGRLSVKLRVGYEEDFDYLCRFCTMLKEEGVEALTLHPRLAGEKFKGRARWDWVGRLRSEVSLPVTGNGDVKDAEGLCLRASGDCDGVMVGRAAVQKPWIFAEARNPGSQGDIDLEDVAARFLDLLARHQPHEFWETRARRFFSYFCDNLKWSHHVKTLLGREKELSSMLAVLRTHFSENPEERWVKKG